MAERRNPYDWQSHHPRVEIPRAEVDRIAEILADGGSAVVLGGRGMGKSVFLRQLRTALGNGGETRVVLISAPPPELTVRACLDQMARHLEAPLGAFNSQAVVDAYFARGDVPERLVLLFDEFDRYAEKGGESANPPGRKSCPSRSRTGDATTIARPNARLKTTARKRSAPVPPSRGPTLGEDVYLS